MIHDCSVRLGVLARDRFVLLDDDVHHLFHIFACAFFDFKTEGKRNDVDNINAFFQFFELGSQYSGTVSNCLIRVYFVVESLAGE